ncbi:zinc-dependent alcohol dehydrogenase [Paracoccus albus]|uniref:zinc-dependent alcohol dehydrogenase n=1 Tax=Paracoccus albus TaxID=3017784 RepID=UPI0022F0A636|nr:alcohol dehydrogenase catalytic domain-containing protein [Paracoccus albus]WBU61264.1 alcohol dehydrogenase catalytic domain-containing protein [Paracoccus albus]
MRAVRLHGIRDLRVEDIAAPSAPGIGQVTIAVASAGICGSDLHNFSTGAWITRAPSVAGHEFCGTVTAIGAGVSSVTPGQKVVLDSRVICGECPECRAGLGQVCRHLGFLGEVMDGGFAELVTVPARNVLPAPEGVADRHLAMAEPLAVALHALRRLALPKDATLLIAGCGPIGGLIALLASRDGHVVLVADRNEGRARLVADTTGAQIVRLADHAALAQRFAVDTTGSDAVISSLLSSLSGAGRLALVGIGKPKPVIDPVYLVEREISLLGCHAFTDEDLRDATSLLADLSDALDDFIGEEITLHDVPSAYERLIVGTAEGLKTIICCGEA